MICNKIRQSKKIYCSNDFFYQVKIVQTEPIRGAGYNEYDAKKSVVLQKDIMCYLKKTEGVEFNAGGEAVEIGTSLKVICNYFSIIELFDDMEDNNKDYYIIYDKETYQLLHAHKVDLRNNYAELTLRKQNDILDL